MCYSVYFFASGFYLCSLSVYRCVVLTFSKGMGDFFLSNSWFCVTVTTWPPFCIVFSFLLFYSAVSSCVAVNHHYKHVYVFKLLRIKFQVSSDRCLTARSRLSYTVCSSSCEAVSHQYKCLSFQRSLLDCSIAFSLILFVRRSSMVLYVL